MKVIAVAFFLVFSASAVLAADLPEPLEIIQEEGQFVFTDGSSYYQFKKDGTFKSGPLGIQGREITGTWKSPDRRFPMFVIVGRWSWINGLSPRDDYRKLTLYIGHPVSVETVEQLSLVDGSRNVKVYKCYFMVDELQKIPKPRNIP
ncbi:MAG TPA: hypothetical protein VF708_01490 [Pyrinomonadaceae bacterium]